jgi:hypothetical protein
VSKPLTYRGVRYTIAKGPSLTTGRMCWLGIIIANDGALRLIAEAWNKGEVLAAVKFAICPTPPVRRAPRPVSVRRKIGKLRAMTAGNDAATITAGRSRYRIDCSPARLQPVNDKALPSA